MTTLTIVRLIVGAIVILCWFGFLTVLLKRPKHGSSSQKRDRMGMIGFELQMASYLIVLPFHFTRVSSGLDYAALVASLVSACASLGLMYASVRHLGKQWSLNARVLTDHKLVTNGPYSLVRHPIYTAMLGILVANIFLFHSWLAAIAGLICFAIGTRMRVKSEEKLLREAFGQEFTDYSRRVPAIIPWFWLSD